MIDLIGQALSLVAWLVQTGLGAYGLICLMFRDPNPSRTEGRSDTPAGGGPRPSPPRPAK